MFDGRAGRAGGCAQPARGRPAWASFPASCATARKSIAASLTPREADARLTQLYQPYHARPGGLVEETRARFGVAVVIDCHSMPSALSVPDIVLGDRYGASAPPQLTARAEDAFVARGFFAWRATRPMPAATPPCCMAASQRAVMRCRSRSIAGSIWTKTASQRKAGFDALKKRLTRGADQTHRHRSALLAPHLPPRRPAASARNNVSESPQILARGILRSGQERARERGLSVHERRRDARQGRKRPRAKKWPLRGAAKFREETPRKGGGFAIKDRNTALQQYDGNSISCASVKI